jgi:serine/threonine protein phosphatase PrpC
LTLVAYPPSSSPLLLCHPYDPKLHEDRRVDDSLSGTTSISVLFIGSRVYVCNVGDSRAIVVSDVDGKLKASPLSSDQTPYRKDERERVKKYVIYNIRM